MEELERLIREEIQREGSVSFARFMERATLEPGLGYYATPQRRAGRSGDFMTAPELHPILGAAIAQLATATWERLGRPATFRWREFGAGEGTLLLTVLDYLARERHPLLAALEVSVTEANPHRLADLAAALKQLPAGGPPLVAAGSPPIAGIVVANEFADALPFHIVVGRAASPGGFAERRVTVDPVTNALTWAEGAPDPRVADRLAPLMAGWPPLTEGQLPRSRPQRRIGPPRWGRNSPRGSFLCSITDARGLTYGTLPAEWPAPPSHIRGIELPPTCSASLAAAT